MFPYHAIQDSIKRHSDQFCLHPFQVAGGNAAAYTNAMTTWINKE